MAISEFPPTLSTTVTQLADQIRRQYLRGNQRVPLNRLNGAIVTAATTATVEFTDNVPRPGDVLEIEDELVFVWSVSGQTLSVIQRGFDGTTPASHADDTVIELNARYPRSLVLSTMREEIASWPPSLYAVATGSITAGVNINAMDLDGASGLNGVRLLGVWKEPAEHDIDFQFDRESWSKVARARIEPKQDTTTFPSGYALVLPDGYDPGVSLRVAIGYQFPIATFTSSTDLGSAVGLTRDLLDIIGLGVAARLVTPKEIARVDVTAQGRSRRAEEVREGSISRVGTTHWELRNLRLGEAVKRLASTWGWTESTW